MTSSTHVFTIPSSYDLPSMTFIIPMNSSVVTVIEDFRPTLQDIVKHEPHSGVYYMNLRNGTVRDRREGEIVSWDLPREDIPTEKMYTINKTGLKYTILERYNRILNVLKDEQECIEYDYHYDRDVSNHAVYIHDLNVVDIKINHLNDTIDAMKST